MQSLVETPSRNGDPSMTADTLLANRLQHATPAQRALHERFVQSITMAKRGYVQAAFYLATIADRKIHKVLGYQDLQTYSQEAAGLSPRMAVELSRLGRRLRDLPQIAQAIEDGSLSWGKARMIVASASPETEDEILDIARAHSERELREKLRKPRRRPPRKPTAPGKPATADPQPQPDLAIDQVPKQERIAVTLSFTPEEYARWEAALAGATRARGQSLASLHLAALQAQAPPRTAGDGPGTLLVILECPTCGRATTPTSRGEKPITRALLMASHCDAIAERSGHQGITRREIIPPSLRREVLRRDRYRCRVESCGHARHLEVHHRVPVAAGGRTELSNLITLCRRCHRMLHEQEQETRRAVSMGDRLE